jgi:hypothetical protein
VVYANADDETIKTFRAHNIEILAMPGKINTSIWLKY